MTNHCPRIRPDLKAYADRELPWPRRLVVRCHLAQCDSCRKELIAMTQIADELRAAEDTNTPLDPVLRAKLLAAPTSLFPPELESVRRSFRLPPVWQLAGLGVACIVIVALLSAVFAPAREKVSTGAATALLARDRQIFAAHSFAENDRPAPSPLRPVMQQQISRNIASQLAAPLFKSGMSVSPTLPETLTRQVHNEATLTVQVADAEAGSDQVAQIVKGAGGFVADNTLNTGDDGSRVADLTVRVPVVQFETVLSQLTKLGEVQAKNITGEDITEKTSDAGQAEVVLEDEAHQADAHLKELGSKAGWNDQQDAQNTRIELAQARARLQLLHTMAALSTISIHLAEKPKPVAATPVTSGFFGGLGDTTRAATGSLLSSTAALLSLLIWLLAFAPIWVPLAFAGRYLYRRYHRAAA